MTRHPAEARARSHERDATAAWVVPFTLACGMLTLAPAWGQWTVTNLHPAGATASGASAVNAGAQAGWVNIGSQTRAAIWRGTASSWIDIHPFSDNNNSSMVSAMDNDQQVGSLQIGLAFQHALLWTGTAVSCVDLNPPAPGGRDSWASDVSGGTQVGGTYTDIARAALWRGTAASRVDLHPAGASWSAAFGIDGATQAGYATFGGTDHAGLWRGTAASWTDLHPVGATRSVASDVHGEREGGYVVIGGTRRAALWRGTPESWVDLHPDDAEESLISAVSGPWLVGRARIGGSDRASVWTGTAASWCDLSLFLPGSWRFSYAEAIWADRHIIAVTGWGYNNATQRSEAILWTRIPCAADVDDGTGTGTPNGGVTIEDLLYYMAIYADGAIRADLDDGSGGGTPDGGVTIDDLLYYLARFEAGC